jgi:hypothetical protein
MRPCNLCVTWLCVSYAIMNSVSAASASPFQS